MAKLAITSRTVVSIGLIVLNLDTLLRILRALMAKLMEFGPGAWVRSWRSAARQLLPSCPRTPALRALAAA